MRVGASSAVCSAATCVALLMSNCAEYLAIWLGLTRIGVVVALINSQLAGDVLAHSIKIAEPKYLIVGADLASRVAAIRPRLPPRAGMPRDGFEPGFRAAWIPSSRLYQASR